MIYPCSWFAVSRAESIVMRGRAEGAFTIGSLRIPGRERSFTLRLHVHVHVSHPNMDNGFKS